MTDFSGAVYAGDQLENGIVAGGTFTGSTDITTVASISFAPDSVFTAVGQKIMGVVTNSTVGGDTQTFAYDGYFTATDGSPVYVFSYGTANASSIAINADGDLASQEAAVVLNTGTPPVNPSACFLTGVMIATPEGEVPVERLAPGDLVTTRETGATVARAVIWVGHRHVSLNADAPDERYPVRIRADAFADGAPCRDLLVTSEHCILIEGRLVPARMLVNGASIMTDRAIRSFTYHHLELERHAILVADGLEAESYLDGGNRGAFTGETVTRLLPDPAPRRAAGDMAAPMAVDRETVEPIWRRLAARAAGLGFGAPPVALPTTTDPGLLLLLGDGMRLPPDSRQANGVSFRVPAGARPMALLSRAASPAEMVGPFLDDRRRLGVAVERLVLWTGLDDLVIPAASLGLAGWHQMDGDARWTDGHASLDLPPAGTETMLDVHVIATMTYPAPSIVAGWVALAA